MNSEKKLRKLQISKKKESRGDDYFALQKRGYPKKAFRIRNNGKDYTVNFKKRRKSLFSSDIVVKEEFEFKILDLKHFDNFIALLRDFGFKEWVKKRKTTEGYLYKKDKRVVIEINHVEHIGYYMEIEYLAKESEVKKAKKKIREVLKELEIKSSEIDNIGYTKRLYDKGVKDRKFFIINKFKK